MYISKEIFKKINPFVSCCPRSTKSLFLSHSQDHGSYGHYDDDDDLPNFNESVPISVARLATSEFEQYEQMQNKTVE